MHRFLEETANPWSTLYSCVCVYIHISVQNSVSRVVSCSFGRKLPRLKHPRLSRAALCVETMSSERQSREARRQNLNVGFVLEEPRNGGGFLGLPSQDLSGKQLRLHRPNKNPSLCTRFLWSSLASGSRVICTIAEKRAEARKDGFSWTPHDTTQTGQGA